MAEVKPAADLKHTQISQTLDKMFLHMTAFRPLENIEKIQALWISLKTEGLIHDEPLKEIKNATDALCTIREKMTRNLKARDLVMAWLYASKHQYSVAFISLEKTYGLQVLFHHEPKKGPEVDKEAQEWLQGLSLKIDRDLSKISSQDSLWIALHSAIQRKIEKLENETLKNSLTSWKSLKKVLTSTVFSFTENKKQNNKVQRCDIP